MTKGLDHKHLGEERIRKAARRKHENHERRLDPKNLDRGPYQKGCNEKTIIRVRSHWHLRIDYCDQGPFHAAVIDL